MTMFLLLSTVTEQRHRALLGQMLDKPQGELLPVIFDGAVGLVNLARGAQLSSISTSELSPRHVILPNEKQADPVLPRSAVNRDGLFRLLPLGQFARVVVVGVHVVFEDTRDPVEA